jgi:hypothetical protein
VFTTLIINNYFVHIRAIFQDFLDPGHAHTGQMRMGIGFFKRLEHRD